jgi:hypothetical protein
MKKIFYLLFLTILIAKAFPDEVEKDKPLPHFYFVPFPLPEIATAELGVDLIKGGGSSPYWRFNLLNMHFLLVDYKYFPNTFDFEITPLIVSKNKDIPSYNLTFANLRISYIYYYTFDFDHTIKPFLEINYIFLKDRLFDFNTINLQTGVRFGILTMQLLNPKELFYFETGYAYKNNRHNYFFTIGISPFWLLFPFPDT